ncbi:hypothetical protein [Roseibium album]|uniref:hypothetical protein n=1 Tax=Roseibium album TaxID=311410 RepID=UPI003BAF7E90
MSAVQYPLIPHREDVPIMTGLLSRNSSYALTVQGDFGSREIGNLIRILELQKRWAEGDEANEPSEPEYSI